MARPREGRLPHRARALTYSATRAQQVDRAALERWKTAALGGPVIVSIVGDHQKLDDDQLTKLAPVILVPVTKLCGD